MFDWDKEWHAGEAPHTERGWKQFTKDHPVETLLLFLIAIGLIVWWGLE